MKFHVLRYHGLFRNREELAGATFREYVSEEEFGGQVRWLKERGYAFLTLAQCRERWGREHFPEKAVCVAFDDGKQSGLRLAAPILAREGAVATYFVVPGWLGRRNVLERSEVRKLAALGMEIGSHSLTHPFMTRLAPGDLERETSGSKAYLEDLLGRPVESFSYPWGDTNRRVQAAVREAGYQVGCGAGRGANASPADWLLLNCCSMRLGLTHAHLQEMLNRRSTSLGESFVQVLRRVLGMRRFVAWSDVRHRRGEE